MLLHVGVECVQDGTRAVTLLNRYRTPLHVGQQGHSRRHTAHTPSSFEQLLNLQGAPCIHVAVPSKSLRKFPLMSSPRTRAQGKLSTSENTRFCRKSTLHVRAIDTITSQVGRSILPILNDLRHAAPDEVVYRSDEVELSRNRYNRFSGGLLHTPDLERPAPRGTRRSRLSQR